MASELDAEWQTPLYGFHADELPDGAGMVWADFASTFNMMWRELSGEWPHRDLIMRARQHWRRYHMTGYEAFVHVRRELAEGKFPAHSNKKAAALAALGKEG